MDASCIACNGELILFGPRLNYEYYICSSCGTLQLSPMPDEKTLENAYSQHHASFKQTDAFRDPKYWKIAGEPYRKDILRVLINHSISGLIIDFGAGWGHLCELLIKNKFHCIGLEPSLEMSSYCRQKGLPVEHWSFESDNKIDKNISAIVMCTVFEHLSNHHTWLRRFNRMLPLNGSMVTLHPTAACYTLIGKMIRLGNRNRELPEMHGSFFPPWHTAFFSLKAMEILAHQNGFGLIEIRPASQGRAAGFFGFTQRCLGVINRFGWFMMQHRWPLITTHVFVLRKMRNLN